MSGIGAPSIQGSAVEAAGGHLHLGNGAVGLDSQLLSHGLAAEAGAIGLAMIEDVPLLPDLHHAAVVVTAVVHGLVPGLIAVDAKVIVGDNDTTVLETLCGGFAGCVAQLVEHHGRVDKVIGVSVLADGRRLKELVTLKAAALAVGLTGSDKHRRLFNGEHIRTQHGAHGTVAALVPGKAETGVKIGAVPFCQDARIELGLIALLLTQKRAVRIVDIAVKLEFPSRGITHGHGNHALVVQHIVEIIPAVRALGHIRSIQAHTAIGVEGILGLFIDDALIPPVTEVVHRGGPSDIVVQAISVTVEPVMRAVDIHPAVKNVGFAVRDVLPGGQIGVERLFVHHGTLLPWSEKTEPFQF